MFREMPSLSGTEIVKDTCVLPRETCCHGGSLFTGNGRLVQRYQGSQVPLPTGGLPRGERQGGKGGTEAGMKIAMAFCNTPGFVWRITMSIMSIHSFLTALYFLLQLVPKLTRNFMKEGFMEKTGPKVCTMILLRGTSPELTSVSQI